MAGTDLTEIQAAQSVKIIGSDATGLETNPVDATTKGLKVDVQAQANMSDVAGTGTITALAQTVAVVTNGASTAVFNITGTWVATLLFEGLDGNGLWVGCLGTTIGNGSPTSSTGTNSAVAIPCGGFSQVRVRCSAYVSGTATVNVNAGSGIQAIQIFNLTPAGLQATVRAQDGSGNALTSTSLGGKQRLDVGTASEGVDGATAPTNSMQVGGKDPSGNLQSLNTDAAGNIFVSDKVPTTPSAPATATVAATSGSAVSANASRKGLIIQNLSANTVSLNVVGGAAVLNSGITLFPGGTWNMDQYSFTTSAIFAIASAAGSVISIQEFS